MLSLYNATCTLQSQNVIASYSVKRSKGFPLVGKFQKPKFLLLYYGNRQTNFIVESHFFVSDCYIFFQAPYNK